MTQTKKSIFLFFLSIIAVSFLLIPIAHATEVFSDGFESGNFNAWTGTSGSNSIVTSPIHTGSKAAQLDTTSGFIWKDLGDTYPTLYARMYWRISDLPANNKFVDLIDLSAGQGAYSPVADVGYGQVGGVYNWYTRLMGEYAQGYIQTIDVDTWYCIEIKCVVSATVGEIRVWINGVERITRTGLNMGSTNLGRVYAMFYQAPWAANVFYDCVVVADAYIGPESEMQNLSFALSQTVTPAATLYSQKALTKTSSETSYSTSGLSSMKFLTRICQTSTSITSVLQGTKSLTQVIVQNLESAVVTAVLGSLKALKRPFLQTMTITETVDVAKYLHALFVENLETATIHDLLNPVLGVAWTTDDAVALAAIALIFGLSALALIAVKHK